jgi:hypothetical protein
MNETDDRNFHRNKCPSRKSLGSALGNRRVSRLESLHSTDRWAIGARENDQVSLSLPGGSFGFKPLILKASFPETRWKGKFLLGGLFDGEHYFRLESVSPNITRFFHGEHLSGVLVGLLSGALEKTKRGFQLMNEALKKIAER